MLRIARNIPLVIELNVNHADKVRASRQADGVGSIASITLLLLLLRLARIVLGIDQCSPVENVASLVNGFLIHVVISHRHLHVTVT